MTTRAKGPRRVTPTQARAARRARRQFRRRLLRYGALTLVGMVAAAFIVALFLPSFSFAGGGIFGDLFRSTPGGPGERMEDQGADHIESGQSHAPYNSVPATSGWHYALPLAPAAWGVNDKVLQDEVLIHNLEHGGVGVHYDCPDGCDELVDQLSQIVDRSAGEGLKVIMSPYPDMGSRIALTAWTFLDKFDAFDEDRVKEFIQAHESSPNAPEPTAR